MQENGTKNLNANVSDLGFTPSMIHWNLHPEELTQQTIERGQGTITDVHIIG